MHICLGTQLGLFHKPLDTAPLFPYMLQLHKCCVHCRGYASDYVYQLIVCSSSWSVWCEQARWSIQWRYGHKKTARHVTITGGLPDIVCTNQLLTRQRRHVIKATFYVHTNIYVCVLCTKNLLYAPISGCMCTHSMPRTNTQKHTHTSEPVLGTYRSHVCVICLYSRYCDLPSGVSSTQQTRTLLYACSAWRTMQKESCSFFVDRVWILRLLRIQKYESVSDVGACAHMCVCVFVCIFAYFCMCGKVHICIHTHTHIHICMIGKPPWW
jgi:hypothetical protein